MSKSKDMTKIVEGVLKSKSNGKEDVLHVGHDILAEKIQDLLTKYGSLVSVRYFVSDKIVSSIEKAQEEFLKRVMGFADADYGMRYSEVTGYLQTDEELWVGGHDLLKELYGSVGKYLLMEITFHDVKSYEMGLIAARKVAIDEIQGLKRTVEFHMQALGLDKDALQHLQTGLNTLTEASSVVNRELERLEKRWR